MNATLKRLKECIDEYIEVLQEKEQHLQREIMRVEGELSAMKIASSLTGKALAELPEECGETGLRKG